MRGNWKLYIIVIALGMGGFFKALQSIEWKTPASNDAKISTLDIRGMDTNPYSISKEERTRTAGKAKIRAKQSLANKKLFDRLRKQLKKNKKLQAHDFKKGKGVKGNSKKKKGKKKKKKKKKVKIPKGTGKSGSADPNQDSPEEKVVSDLSPTQSGGAPFVQESPEEDKRDKEREDEEALEKWSELLLPYPHFENTSKFIEAHRSRKVSDEVFYTLVNLMLQDTRDEMRVLGIRAADSELNLSSFNALVSVLGDGQSGTKVQEGARRGLRKYQDLSQLHIISNILKNSTDSVALVTAASLLNRMLKSSSKNYDKNKYQELGHHPQLETFQGFVPILQEIIDSNPDAFVLSSVNTAMDSLQTLIEA